MFSRLKELLIGSPLETASLHEQRLSKKAALAVLASDNLSSTAYATEEILLALAAGAAAGLAVPLYYAIPIGVAIGLLTLIVVISYGQTIRAYPTGGGAYTVAKENLGITRALKRRSLSSSKLSSPGRHSPKALGLVISSSTLPGGAFTIYSPSIRMVSHRF